MLMLRFLWLASFVLLLDCQAQTPTGTQVTVGNLAGRIVYGITGMVGISHWKDTSSMTFGGPQMAIQLGEFKLAASFYPSLIRSDLWDHQTRTALGFGAEIAHKRFTLFVPTYFLGNTTRTTIGVGYRF
jgi:hypothetical protein